MQAKAVFNEKQPEYRYFPIGNNKADVFIYSFVEEVTDEEGTSFIYEMNEFRTDMDEITEKMVKKNPLSYLDYSNEVEKVALEDRINIIEDAFNELCEVIFNG